MNNMQQLMARAQKLQAKVDEAQRKLGKEEVTGVAGAGAIKLVLTLNGELKSISIDKSVIIADEKEILEDLILVAFKDAKAQADARYSQGIKEATNGLHIPGF